MVLSKNRTVSQRKRLAATATHVCIGVSFCCCTQVIEHVEELKVVTQPASLGRALSSNHNDNEPETMGQPGVEKPLLEAMLGHGLRHPNVVETYKYATRQAEVC